MAVTEPRAALARLRELLELIQASTMTIGSDYGNPHVAARAGAALSVMPIIERLLEDREQVSGVIITQLLKSGISVTVGLRPGPLREALEIDLCDIDPEVAVAAINDLDPEGQCESRLRDLLASREQPVTYNPSSELPDVGISRQDYREKPGADSE